MMRSFFCSLFVITFFLTSCVRTDSEEELTIFLQEKGAEIAPSMFGVFFEEINHAGDGGLYAELVKNRSFEELEMPDGYRAEGDRLIPKQVHNHVTGQISDGTFRWTTEPVPGWSLNTEKRAAEMELTKENPKFKTAPNNLKVSIKDASTPVSLMNEGYWGMGVKAGEKYHLRTIVRTSSDYKGTITAKIISEKGDILANTVIETQIPNQWADYKAVLTPVAKDPRAKLILEFDATGEIWLDYVSLFPENTFKQRANGLRDDVANMIAGLNPAFVRWPGGCVVEGISLENRFEWKKTLGDPAARPGEYSTWGYRCSYGFGFYELLQFCEDINADAMYVCNVGLGCQFRMADASPESQIAYYLDDCLDAIEYAIGDVSTEWGAKRAEHGHPSPFPLKYVEIGNENWGDEYDKRFDIFYKAIKEKYPELVLISNHGLGGTGKIEKTDMVDPHWYVSPDFFFRNATIFDEHPRGNYTVYVGEYACNNNVGGGNMIAALSEAAFITGMERNSDLVTMASYAPLLENRNDRAWAVNLIWLDTDQVVGRSSYYVQKMTAENIPTYNVRSSMNQSQPKLQMIEDGAVGFGSYETEVEFKEIIVKQGDKRIDLDIGQFSDEKGEWKTGNGILSQTSMQHSTRRILKGLYANDYTLEFKARRTGGKEGFFIYFGITGDHQKGQVFNVGGWDNSTTAVQLYANGNVGSTDGSSIPQSLETNRWYDVKLVVTPEKAELFMDGESVLSYVSTSEPLQFFSSGYDETTGEIIVKVVNAADVPYVTNVKLDGASHVEKTGKIISLTAISGEEENSFDEPKKIYPQESFYNKFGREFGYSFPPFSYTILRVKATI
ncbi:alpha-L-arabinofuranosidase C-terminal domain-containing protein [Proteiniphilum sp.]|uniref:alpha-L-arabinofuranosidase C-terminal domain-containing protein n=1 Tax=Proteiniphilum sp. TaxID=1926877 RepID=UPI0033175595